MNFSKQSTTTTSSIYQIQLKIRKYLMQLWTTANQFQNQFNINSDKIKATLAKLKIQSYQQMSKAFIKCIHYSNSNNIGNDPNEQKILGLLKQKLKIQGVSLPLLLGLTIQRIIMENQQIKNLHKTIKSVMGFSDDSSSQSDIQIQFQSQRGSHIKKQQQLQKIANVYAFQTDNEKQKNLNSQSSQFPSIDFTDQTMTDDITINFGSKQDSNYNSDFFQHQIEEVKQYLNRLSKSTTQLSYLCQRMKWGQPQYIQDKSKINNILFSCTVSINVRLKNHFFQLTSNCPGATSKKQAKRICSLYLLRKIYNRIPQVWENYKSCRQKNPVLCLQLNANNEQIFKKANFNILQASVFRQQKQKVQLNYKNKQIQQYLSKITSYKAEINVLIGKYKKISPPQLKPDKQDELSLWPVSVQITDDGVPLKAFVKQSSKKKAEQMCCKELLFELYSRNLPRWQQFKKYKQFKKITC